MPITLERYSSSTPELSDYPLDLTYNASNELVKMKKAIGDKEYEKTLTYADGNLTKISKWIEV